VVAVDAQGSYAGIVWLSDAHAAGPECSVVGEVLHQTAIVLTPEMTVKSAIDAFARAEADALAVVDGLETNKVVGLLTEHYALRRYAEELESRRRDLGGE
jgi:CIC family chloride channel protein